MAGGLVQAEAVRLLEASTGKTAYVAPTTGMDLELTTTLPTATAAGTAVAGGSYAKQPVTWAAAVGGAPSTIANSGALNYTNMPAATVVGIDVYDRNGTPRRAWWGPLTASRTTLLGDSITFAIGALSLSLA